MTEWNPNDPYDLGIWDELGESSPASETEDLLPLKRTKTARKPIANKKSKQEARLQRVVNGKRGFVVALCCLVYYVFYKVAKVGLYRSQSGWIWPKIPSKYVEW